MGKRGERKVPGMGTLATVFPLGYPAVPPPARRANQNRMTTDKPSKSDLDVASTMDLLHLARSGDSTALAVVFDRYLPRMRRWASGRLPRDARNLMETDDLVQDVLLRTVQRAQLFDPRTPLEFYSYLRLALTNRIRDEVRRLVRTPGSDTLSETLMSDAPSPIERLLGRDQLQRYEAALQRLKPEDREAVIARLELDCPYAEIATVLRKNSADAARQTVARALVRLAEEMNDVR